MSQFGIGRVNVLGLCSTALLAGILAGSSATAGAQPTTELVSVHSLGNQGNNPSEWPTISANGRYVAFHSRADNLVTGDGNSALDVFVHDRQTGVTERVSVSTGGVEGNADSWDSSISSGGRYVAFKSSADNLVAGDTNGWVDVFVHDRQTGVTERVSVSSGGIQANGECVWRPSISGDGSFVAFASGADNLVAADTNSTSDVFVRDLKAGVTERVSVNSDGEEGDNRSLSPSISSDGRFVAFVSLAGNLVSGDANYVYDIFVHDWQTGVTERVSVDTTGADANGESDRPSISADGRYVAFDSWATDLVFDGSSSHLHVFLRDRLAGLTQLMSVNSAGEGGNGGSLRASVSADGNCVAFDSSADNLVAGDTNGFMDVFVRNRLTGVIERVSLDSGGVEGNYDSNSPSISADGNRVAFMSGATNLVPSDLNNARDVFLRLDFWSIFSDGFEFGDTIEWSDSVP